MSGIVDLWKTNKVFKYGVIVVGVCIVLGIFTYFGTAPPE